MKIAEAWKALDVVHPKHRMAGQWHEMYKGTRGYCTDDAPSGHGNFGCARCDAIMAMEKRGMKIWPRSEREGR